MLMSLSPRSARIKKSASAGIGESYECCGAELSGNSITLITAAFLFALITGVQYVFALIANSLALQADCLSMGVDALTYLGNLAVECMPDDDEKNMCSKKGVELAMAGVLASMWATNESDRHDVSLQMVGSDGRARDDAEIVSGVSA